MFKRRTIDTFFTLFLVLYLSIRMLASEFISSILQLAASLAVKHLSLLISEELSSIVNAQLFVKNCPHPYKQ